MTDQSSSRAAPLGVTPVDGGVNVAVYSETAEAVVFCVFDDEGNEARHELRERTGWVFHGFVPDVRVGARYALRVHGTWDPGRGLRFNPAKLLIDPHAKAIHGEFVWGQPLFGHRLDDPAARDDSDSAGLVPLSVVIDNRFDWGSDTPPRTPLAETVIYETHVKGFTRLHPEVPEQLRGTYAGLAHPAAIEHLTSLGVTAVELLPVHQFVHDAHLLAKGLRNYWGYNTIGFFAPHSEYAGARHPGAQVAEFKAMVRALHAAGIEVILDVVYNHTAEGNHLGPTLSLKGIDNAAYYRLAPGDPSHYYDTTGTGNSVNSGHPATLRLIMDSLRYWAQDMHVDGFRFDLATTLTRQSGDPDARRAAFLDIVHQDPALTEVKKIAEPWDLAGYQVGAFPAEWSEWNGLYRDNVRDYWRGADRVLGTLSQRILGSPDVYERSRRSPTSSVNYVTAHDGFTLADLTSYNQKHNWANGEENRDGSDDNRSSNNGAEGATENPVVLERRGRQRRNFLATLLLSAGVPMILGGDEFGRSQGGNNNAYCQDNETSWYDWAHRDDSLQEFTARLIALRRENPALRPPWYRLAAGTAAVDLVDVLRADGRRFEPDDWADPAARAIAFRLDHRGADSFLLLLNAAENGVVFTLPAPPLAAWRLELSSDPLQRLVSPDSVIVRDCSFTLLRSSAGG